MSNISSSEGLVMFSIKPTPPVGLYLPRLYGFYISGTLESGVNVAGSDSYSSARAF